MPLVNLDANDIQMLAMAIDANAGTTALRIKEAFALMIDTQAHNAEGARVRLNPEGGFTMYFPSGFEQNYN